MIGRFFLWSFACCWSVLFLIIAIRGGDSAMTWWAVGAIVVTGANAMTAFIRSARSSR